MQNFRNYYEILGVVSTATDEEIKRSFRRLARQCHPDLNPGDKAAEERFKTISEAYEILSDTDRRARYDQFSRYWKQKGFQSTPHRRTSQGWSSRPGDGIGNDVDYGQFPDFNTFVEELLGKTPARSGFSRTTVTRRTVTRRTVTRSPVRPESGAAPPPSDRPFDRTFTSPSRVKTTRTVTARPPASKTLTASRPQEAPPLRDFRPGVTKTAYTVPSRSAPRSTPRDVEAKLVISLEKAYHGGTERLRMEGDRIVEVEMPGGLVSGQKVRLRGQGMNGGDLYLLIEILPHSLFRLQGADIHCQLPITAIEAILGVPIAVPTLDGLVEMTLPPGVRSGQSLRLAGKGYPGADGSRGDQIVRLEILIPPTLTSAERNLYEQIYAIESFKPRQGIGGHQD